MSQYTDEQNADNYPPGIERLFWIGARNAIIHDLVKASGMAGGRILDVGCGRGIVVEYLRKRNIDCIGCELSQPPVPEDLAPYITTGIEARALARPERESVESLMMLDVIEHIENAPAFMQEVADSFPNARTLLVTVPAHAELWSNWDAYYGHYRRYSRRLLTREIEKAGFKDVEVVSFFHSLYVPMRLMPLLGLKRTLKQSTPHNAVLHRLLGRLFFLEFKMLPSRLIGTSFAAVARR